jgi:hypothetical protein
MLAALSNNNNGDIMNKIITSLFLGSLILIGGAASAAMAAADPVIGTWKLNAAKSSAGAGSETRTYSQSDKGISVEISTVGADGKANVQKTTYHLDGKTYPATGGAGFDSLSAKQVDANTADFSLIKGGKAVGSLRRAVSADGKTLTVTTEMTDAKGAKTKTTNIYDKQ